jgi:hypothetical protein
LAARRRPSRQSDYRIRAEVASSIRARRTHDHLAVFALAAALTSFM